MEYMNEKAAIVAVRANWRRLIAEITEPAKLKVNGEESYICPLCGHGRNGDGLTFNPRSADGNGLKCFGTCGFSGDIIDLYRKVNGSGYLETLAQLAEKLGYTVDIPDTYGNNTAFSWGDFDNMGAPITATAAQSVPAKQEPTTQADYSAYFTECAKRIKDPAAVEYLTRRGISPETAESYGIGYDPQADPAQSGHKSARIIIPTSKTHYIARAIDPLAQIRVLNPKGGKTGIFNESALYAQDVKEIFVTEGAFDALSLLEVGAHAIALNSTSNAGELLKRLESRRTTATLILALDNDTAGKEAASKLLKGLQALNVRAISANISGGFKDPNEYLQHEPTAFATAVHNTAEESRKESGKQLKSLLMSYSEMRTTPAPLEWLVKGVIQQEGIHMFFGNSGSGKSLMVIDLAQAIATPTIDTWYGRKVKHGRVFYWTGEGHKGMRGRVEAWAQTHGNPKESDIYYSTQAVDLNTPDGFNLMCFEIGRTGEEPPVLIIIDTLNLFLSGDENSAEDSRGMIDNLHRLMNIYSCSTLVIHHTGVNPEAQNRARGSSAWRGAMDIEAKISCTKASTGEKLVYLEQTKNKDAEMIDKLAFKLKTVILPDWIDEDGDQVKGPYLEPYKEGNTDRPKEKKITASQAFGLSTYYDAAKLYGQIGKDGTFRGVHLDDWRKEFYAQSTRDGQASKRSHFNRVRKELTEGTDKRLEVRDDFYTLCGDFAEIEIENILDELRMKLNPD